MCLLLFYVNPTPSPDGYYLILVNVRDEIYHRPTQLASFWEQHPTVIGGRDMEPGREGGTWLAMNKNGRIGALLNILQPDAEILPNKKGRGFLAVDYAVGSQDCLSYLSGIGATRNDYNGFLLVALDLRFAEKSPQMAYVTNAIESPPVTLEPGMHTFGNSSPGKPWPKVVKSKERFSEILSNHSSVASKETLVEDLFDLLQDRTRYALDDQMKSQGKNKSEDFMNRLSAIFVHIPHVSYGSRCHTVILVDSLGNADYFERSRKESEPANSMEKWESKHFFFKLEQSA